MAVKMGINTDNWRLENPPLESCVRRTAELGVKWIEFDTLLGFDFIEGLGFSPAVSSDTDPLALRDLLAEHDLKCSCLDAHYPMWSYRCIDYMTKAILFAGQIGCEAIATTDSEEFPPRYDKDESIRVFEYHLDLVLEVAQKHNVVVCIEPHGQLTSDPMTLTQILEQNDHPLLKVNFDTGNSFICGHDPVEFLKAVVDIKASEPSGLCS
ncbi:sugar phosphate isomerase/epimerase, partial [bacterium]|nr:sugar phosphate isomerase/epimerase [bacterium]